MIYYGTTQIFLDFELSTDMEKVIATHNPFCDKQYSQDYLFNLELVDNIVFPNEAQVAMSPQEFSGFIHRWFSMLGLSEQKINIWLSFYVETLQKAFSCLNTKYLDDEPFFSDYVKDSIKNLSFAEQLDIIHVPEPYPELSLEVENLLLQKKDNSILVNQVVNRALSDLKEMRNRFAVSYNENMFPEIYESIVSEPIKNTALWRLILCTPIEGDIVRTNTEYIFYMLKKVGTP